MSAATASQVPGMVANSSFTKKYSIAYSSTLTKLMLSGWPRAEKCCKDSRTEYFSTFLWFPKWVILLGQDLYSNSSTLYFLTACSTIIVHLLLRPQKDKSTGRKWVLTLEHKVSGQLEKSLNGSLRIFSSHWKNLRKRCSPCFAVRKIRSDTASLKVMLQEKNPRNLLKGQVSNFHCLWVSLITSARYLMFNYYLLCRGKTTDILQVDALTSLCQKVTMFQ